MNFDSYGRDCNYRSPYRLHFLSLGFKTPTIVPRFCQKLTKVGRSVWRCLDSVFVLPVVMGKCVGASDYWKHNIHHLQQYNTTPSAAVKHHTICSSKTPHHLQQLNTTPSAAVKHHTICSSKTPHHLQQLNTTPSAAVKHHTICSS